MGHDHGHTARLALGDFHHVGDEGIVPLGLGGNAAPEAPVLIRSRMVCAPFFQGEGGIGHHHVKAHQVIPLHQPGAVDGVAPLDACRIASMEEHVHAGQGPCGAIHLLAIEGEVGGGHRLGCLDQQGARTTGRVADGVPRLGDRQLGQEAGDCGGCVELPRFLAPIGRKAGNQVDVALADDVLRHPGRAQIQGRLGEILQQVFEAAVAVFGAAKTGFGVEVDVAEDALQLGAVDVLDGLKGDIDQLADVGGVALGVEVIEACTLGQDEPLPLQAPADARLVVAILLAIGCLVVLPKVGDGLQEQHHQDVVLVLPRINGAPKGVAGGPGGLVDLLLGDWVGHWGWCWC